MDFLVKFASAFMSVFQAGGANFVSWVTGIIPTILMLLVMMNAIIALIGDERIEVIAKVCTSNPILRYAVLPWVSAFKDRSHRKGLHQQPDPPLRSTPLGQRIHARQPDGPLHGQVHA